MVNRTFKYHEVTLADPSSLLLIWCYLQEARTMCVINYQQLACVATATNSCLMLL